MKKKSIFEKLKLVESTEDDFNQEDILAALQAQAEEIDSAASSTSINFGENEDFLTISEVYEKAELSDLSRSIFKVEEFGKHLPDNLPSDVKRQSVIGILTASGLQLDELLDDAEKRVSSLKEVATFTSQKSDEDIIEKEQEITDLLSKVDSLKQSIIDRKSSQEKQNDLINGELEKITQILKFVSVK